MAVSGKLNVELTNRTEYAEHVQGDRQAWMHVGRWTPASEIAKEHDPRKKPVIEGFDDTRAEDYISLYNDLALAATRSGDDDAAAAFLAKSKAVADGGDARFLMEETLFAGAAEGRLPRKYLHVLMPAFRTTY